MTPRALAILGAVLVGLLGVGSLVSTAFHANTTATQLVSEQQRRDANSSNAFYSCLEAQGHQLIRPTDRVYLSQPNLDYWVKLTKALGGWAHLQAHRAHATVAVLLVPEPQHAKVPTCRDSTGTQALVTVRITPSGRVVMAHAVAPGPRRSEP